MNSTLTPGSFVERLLDSDSPVWHRWDGDLPTLLKTLETAALHAFSRVPSDGRRGFKLDKERPAWLLHRLAPKADASLFEGFLTEPLGIYAWGCRLPPERRYELIDLAPSFPSDTSRIQFLQAAMLAWCDSCPEAELSTLLEWRQFWQSVLRPHDGWWLPAPEREFARRCSDAKCREEALLATLSSLQEAHHSDEASRDMGRSHFIGTFLLLLELAAKAHPCPVPPQTTKDGWIAWFAHAMDSPAFTHLAQAKGAIFAIRTEYFAQSLWIWQHGTSDWRQLADYASFMSDRRLFERLAEIVPDEELDCWDGIVECSQENAHAMRAYCRWIAPRYSEALRTHFNHSDEEWGACAFQGYLAKAPEALLHHHARRSRDLPAWQWHLLDRRLYAPPELRPSLICHDIQDVEGDLRLQDPFNHRSF